MKEDLEVMRKELQNKLNCNELNSDEVLKLSQQLDKLIVEFCKSKPDYNKKCTTKGGSLC
ncbi:aspartyl-phosphate phosphatase Spo0E family protein [Acetivibrio cellulolyticus]|uniref:aspartyl-phosphate phosphatase Spo0E family protein n=1 Tax=Acetivibrio cellulolyticus TaxID=35830 RepID=UPI0001E2F681|nr:aspartyl-phosphate phosphatase Spo0E family protein [Acetivibrio cellulolyticus]